MCYINLYYIGTYTCINEFSGIFKGHFWGWILVLFPMEKWLIFSQKVNENFQSETPKSFSHYSSKIQKEDYYLFLFKHKQMNCRYLYMLMAVIKSPKVTKMLQIIPLSLEPGPKIKNIRKIPNFKCEERHRIKRMMRGHPRDPYHMLFYVTYLLCMIGCS